MDDKQRLTQDNINDVRYGDKEGIRCPACHCRDFYTYRTERIGEFVRRTKICRNCQNKIHTTETYTRQIR